MTDNSFKINMISIILLLSLNLSNTGTPYARTDSLSKTTSLHIKDTSVYPNLRFNENWLNLIDSSDLRCINNSIGKINEINRALQLDVYSANNNILEENDIDTVKISQISELVNCIKHPINKNELTGYNKVKSIQCNTMGPGIAEYGFFPCRFYFRNNKIFFQKIGGSQRKSGYLYRKDEFSYVFLGAWSVNENPTTEYGGEYSTAGIMYKVAPDTLVIIFIGDSEYEIYFISRR